MQIIIIKWKQSAFGILTKYQALLVLKTQKKLKVLFLLFYYLKTNVQFWSGHICFWQLIKDDASLGTIE